MEMGNWWSGASGELRIRAILYVKYVLVLFVWNKRKSGVSLVVGWILGYVLLEIMSKGS
jgi:hypothetical protein